MAATPAQRALAEIARLGVRPVLEGFERSGHTWRRTRSRCVQVVQVQASAYGSAASLRFTLNLGVYFPAVQAVAQGLFGWVPGPAGPTADECHVRARIGELLPTRRDRWWQVGASTDRAKVAAEVARALASRGVPWLGAMSSMAAARREAERSSAPGVPVAFALAARDRRGARARMAALLAESPEADVLRQWAEELGFA